jgi:hypothetical protein
MDPVKASASQALKATEASKRPSQQAKSDVNPDAVAAKKAAEQAARPTTNTRGETLGRHLNVTA